jgi:hypothetical protein
LADLAELVEQWHQIGSWNPTWVTIRLCVDVFVRLGEHQVAGQLLGAMEASTTAGPIYGADADRLASAEARCGLGSVTRPTTRLRLAVQRWPTPTRSP